ncbi:hypothetical protein MNBD_GAMMA11-2217 [hydrothermal vent metagenome]|uniref:Serine aminopeptidase S33 domain-containing protein n=1 Tax=hydrothermal vent metagenome TaxID=652676 RepID=A0A3B0Y8F8_9ZZZZ
MNNDKAKTRNVMFSSAAGYQLAASIDYLVGIEPVQCVIMTHCFTCNKQTLTTARLSRGLAQAGFVVLRLDFTGLGESGGDFSTSHFSSMVSDIESAGAFLSDNYQPASALIGHSMGGTACLAASQNGCSALSEVSRLVTLASPAHPDHVLHHFGSALLKLERGENAEIRVAGKDFPVVPGFIENIRSYNMDKQMRSCHLPILAVRAGRDALVGAEDADQIMSLTSGPATLFQIDEADHLFSHREHADILLDRVSGWFAS